jgi:hypothetical protein
MDRATVLLLSGTATACPLVSSSSQENCVVDSHFGRENFIGSCNFLPVGNNFGTTLKLQLEWNKRLLIFMTIKSKS